MQSVCSEVQGQGDQGQDIEDHGKIRCRKENSGRQGRGAQGTKTGKSGRQVRAPCEYLCRVVSKVIGSHVSSALPLITTT